MSSIPYTYLIGSLIFLAMWGVIFYFRKDLRREMLLTGSMGSLIIWIGGAYWFTHDWWYPQTILGNGGGIEDIIFGFANFGIAAVIYDVVFHKRYSAVHWHKPKIFIGIFLLLTITGFLSVCLFLNGAKSFIAYPIVALLASSVLWFSHRQLFINSLGSGFLLMLISIPVYWVLNFISPGWITHTYLFNSLTGITLFTVPIEEYVYYFATGMAIGPLFEYSKRID